MRNISRQLILAVGTALVFTGIRGLVPASQAARFEQIPKRNLFNLKEPEKIMAPTNPPPQLPRLLLTGIATVLGNKQALLKELAPGQPAAQPPGQTNKAGEAAAKDLMLTEGQREGDVEVLQIDEKAGSVKVNNSGTVMTLTFEKDGPKLPSTSAPTNPTPLMAGAIAPPMLPGALPSNYPPGLPNTNIGIRSFPSRSARWPATAAIVPGASQPANSTNPPGVPPAFLPGQQPQGGAQLPQGLTAEEERIVQQFQRTAQPPTSPGFQTPPQEGIAPAFAPPPQQLPTPRSLAPQ